MIVKINFTKVILILFSLSFFTSCNEHNNSDEDKTENTYEIINLISRGIKEQSIIHPSFPPPPGKEIYTYSQRDSLKKYKYFYEQYSKKKTIAFVKNMYVFPEQKPSLLFNECGIGEELISRIQLIEKEEKLDINKIFLSEKDSLIYDNKNQKNRLEGIDFSLEFSRIVFNEKLNKVILIVSVHYEKLNSLSFFYYLEKKNFSWKVECEKVLSFS